MQRARERVPAIVRAFDVPDGTVEAAPLAGGHINESYHVSVRGAQSSARYLLQRLNPVVFPDGARVMENIEHVTDHLQSRLRAAGYADWQRRTLSLVPTRDGRRWLRDSDGGCWRLVRWIEGTHALVRPRGPADARNGARAFGELLVLLADYDGPPLHETIRGFHDTESRFATLESAARADPRGRLSGCRAELDALLRRRDLAATLPALARSGELPRRIVHNDAKLANVLFDDHTDEALCVVDLDTVMPGSALHDFGDLVRSMTSPAVEDERDLSRVGVQPSLFAAVAAGYLEAAGDLLTATERKHLVFAGKLITLEQAVRFLADHLLGDRYYAVSRADHNLDRARVQLRLLETLEGREPELAEIVTRARPVA